MSQIAVTDIAGYGTTVKGVESNTRVRSLPIHQIYKGDIKDVLAKLSDGDPETVANFIKFDKFALDDAISIAEVGQIQDIVVDESNRLLDGEGRAVAIALGQGIRKLGEDAFTEVLKQVPKGTLKLKKEETLEDWGKVVFAELENIPDSVSTKTIKKSGSEANILSMDANLRHRFVNPLDIGIFFAEQIEAGRSVSELATRYFPSISPSLAVEEVKNHVQLTKADEGWQNKLRTGQASMKTVLSLFKEPAENGDVGQFAYRCSAKELHNALASYNGGHPQKLYSILGDEFVETHAENIAVVLDAIYDTKEKISAEKKEAAEAKKEAERQEKEAKKAARKKAKEKADKLVEENVDLQAKVKSLQAKLDEVGA